VELGRRRLCRLDRDQDEVQREREGGEGVDGTGNAEIAMRARIRMPRRRLFQRNDRVMLAQNDPGPIRIDRCDGRP
jgi:hypothetical protein